MTKVALAADGQGVIFNGQHFLPDADGNVDIPDEAKEYLESQGLTKDTATDPNTIPEETPNLNTASGATALVPEAEGSGSRRRAAKVEGDE